ncbi:MAG: hypothetical protein PHN84_00190 [Desulfuromonadaceae bacterium]|nr:hypothetical protein [Desulfuromonadaceae bacterium]MDD2855923.1 hypothetical protein [Desulfuromonadaceae bacterium]
MSSPRTPGIYIGMMTLVVFSLLVWSSIVAPCVEIGIFLASATSAVGTAFMSWRLSSRLGQKEMLLVYVSLAAVLTAAVTALVDFADITFLGELNDAESGLLLGGVLAFVVVGWIAVRLSERFPLSLTLGSVIACSTSWGFISFFGKSIEQEYQSIITIRTKGDVGDLVDLS